MLRRLEHMRALITADATTPIAGEVADFAEAAIRSFGPLGWVEGTADLGGSATAQRRSAVLRSRLTAIRDRAADQAGITRSADCVDALSALVLAVVVAAERRGAACPSGNQPAQPD